MAERLPDLSGLERIEVGSASAVDVLERVGRRRRGRRVRLAGGAAMLALGAIALGLLGGDQQGSLGPTPVEAAATVMLPGGTVDTAASAGHLWILTCQGRCAKEDPEAKLLEVSAGNGRIQQSFDVNGAQAVASGSGAVWVANFARSTVERVDPETGEVTATISLTLPRPVAGNDARLLPTELAYGDGSLWVLGGRGYAAQIDPSTNTVKAMYEVPLDSGQLLASDDGAWIGGGLSGVVEIDSSAGTVAATPIEGVEGRRLSVSGLAEVDGQLWATGSWAKPIAEAGEHKAFVATSESVLVQIGRTGVHYPATPIPPRLTVLASHNGRLLLARKPRAARIYELHPGAAKLTVALRLEKGGVPLDAQGNNLWIGASSELVKLYKLNTAE